MKAPFLFSILVFLALCAAAKPLPSPKSVETYRDIIDKAYTLSLQRDRAHAVQILTQSIKKESTRGPAPPDLILALEEVASSFYGEKSQQYFEQALSFRRNEPARALQRLGDALKLEPDNLQILAEQGRLQMMVGDCSSAAGIGEKLYSELPSIELSRLILAQASVCAGKLDRARKAKEGVDIKKSTYYLYWSMIEAELYFRAGQMTTARDSLAEAARIDRDFPETQFWIWKLESENAKQSERSAQKYLSLCKSLSPRAARKYINEPQLCRRTSEVETFLKKNNSAGT